MWPCFITGFNLGIYLICILYYTTPSKYVNLKSNQLVIPEITISCASNVCDTTYIYKFK